MTLRYLLDTNILSELIRSPNGRVAEQITKVGESTICTSIIVAAELRFGSRKSGSAKLAERIDLILSAIQVEPLEQPVDRTYAELRRYLDSNGTPIGPNDLFIAAHAIVLDLTLVTANEREFSRIPDLRVLNWLA